MSEISQCVVCERPIVRRKTGRPPKRCTSPACARKVDTAKHYRARTFEDIKRAYLAMGRESAKETMANSGNMLNGLLNIVETYLPAAIGQERVGADIEWQRIVELFPYQTDDGGQRSGHNANGFQVTSHDTPLPSSADIDAAEATGDWSAMTEAALKSMSWQFEHGYVPDLR